MVATSPPRGDFAGRRLEIGYWRLQALPHQHRVFALSGVEPVAVLQRVVPLTLAAIRRTSAGSECSYGAAT